MLIIITLQFVCFDINIADFTYNYLNRELERMFLNIDISVQESIKWKLLVRSKLAFNIVYYFYLIH